MLFVLNKKVLILFSTMDKMNKISTFIPHLSVALHLSPHFTGKRQGAICHDEKVGVSDF